MPCGDNRLFTERFLTREPKKVAHQELQAPRNVEGQYHQPDRDLEQHHGFVIAHTRAKRRRGSINPVSLIYPAIDCS